MNFDARQRSYLLRFGYESIALALDCGHCAPCPPVPPDLGLDVERATFVTLRLSDELRGCCGTLEARSGVAVDVWRNAWAAAFADPRFPPLDRHELENLELQISVLTPLEPIAAADQSALLAALRPGIDGLVLTDGLRRATFLPAVWEHVPEPAAFVTHLKHKGGWRSDEWPPALRAYRYGTECFGTRH
jgi:AmmeMemoRadiSam system protein A